MRARGECCGIGNPREARILSEALSARAGVTHRLSGGDGCVFVPLYAGQDYLQPPLSELASR